jgi:hypothetical protein
MKLILVAFFLLINSNLFGQFIDSSYYSNLNYKQGVDLSYSFASHEVGLKYNYLFWNRNGFKNYSAVFSGASFFPNRNSLGRAVSFNAGLIYNARFSLQVPCYFSMALSYQGILALDPSNSIFYDDYVNAGKVLIGFNCFYKRMKFQIQSGVGIVEQKQDLVFSVHTYAQVKPEFMIHFGFFFDQKKD